MSDNKIIQAIKDKSKELDVEMSFFDHIEILRWHLIRSAIAILIFTCAAFYYYDFLFDKVIMGPMRGDFWTYRMMCKLADALNRPGLCIKAVAGKIINTEMAGQFTLQLNSAFMIGLIAGAPYLLWEVWRFVKPALHETERKAASGFVFYASALFIMGILFGYFIIAPESISFLAGYKISDIIENTFTIDSYLSSVATLTLATGVVFQLPMIVYILSSIGMLTPKFMRNGRRYAIVGILVISAVITPTPDILTMCIVSVPLFVLYEVGIVVAGRVEKIKLKKNNKLVKSNG